MKGRPGKRKLGGRGGNRRESYMIDQAIAISRESTSSLKSGQHLASSELLCKEQGLDFHLCEEPSPLGRKQSRGYCSNLTIFSFSPQEKAPGGERGG